METHLAIRLLCFFTSGQNMEQLHLEYSLCVMFAQAQLCGSSPTWVPSEKPTGSMDSLNSASPSSSSSHNLHTHAGIGDHFPSSCNSPFGVRKGLSHIILFLFNFFFLLLKLGSPKLKHTPEFQWQTSIFYVESITRRLFLKSSAPSIIVEAFCKKNVFLPGQW